MANVPICIFNFVISLRDAYGAMAWKRDLIGDLIYIFDFDVFRTFAFFNHRLIAGFAYAFLGHGITHKPYWDIGGLVFQRWLAMLICLLKLCWCATLQEIGAGCSLVVHIQRRGGWKFGSGVADGSNKSTRRTCCTLCAATVLEETQPNRKERVANKSTSFENGRSRR